MRYLNSLKNQKYFHEKMFKIKQIKTTTTNIKKEKYFQDYYKLVKPLYFFLLSIFNTFLLIIFLEENDISTNEIKENNKTSIKLNSNNLFNNDHMFEDDYLFEDDYEEKNSWFNGKIFFWGGLFIFVCSICAYFFYHNGFSYPFMDNTKINQELPVKNLSYYRNAVLGYISFELIEQYKYDMHGYFINDVITLNEIFYNIQQFIDHAEENSGKVAIKSLEKILSKLIKNKDRLNVGDTEKGIETLRAVIIELKTALIKGFRD